MAQITGKLGQWPPGSTPRAERAAYGLLVAPWRWELELLFRNSSRCKGCSGTHCGPHQAILAVPEHVFGCLGVFRNNSTGTRQILLTTLVAKYAKLALGKP